MPRQRQQIAIKPKMENNTLRFNKRKKCFPSKPYKQTDFYPRSYQLDKVLTVLDKHLTNWNILKEYITVGDESMCLWSYRCLKDNYGVLFELHKQICGIMEYKARHQQLLDIVKNFYKKYNKPTNRSDNLNTEENQNETRSTS